MGSDRRENLVREKCWPYGTSETPFFPVIEVNLRGPRLERELSNQARVRLKVDTGYAGQLMLSSDLYNMGFQLAELPEESFGKYRTATGIVEVQRARAIVEIPELGISMEATVETPRNLRFDRNLAGRRFLNDFELLLKGAQSEACLSITPPSSRT